MPLQRQAVLGLAVLLLTAAVIHAQKPGETKPAEPAAAAGHDMAHPSGAGQAPSGPNPVEELMKSIKGHEQEPADKVFKNVQLLKQVTAGQLIEIMRTGFSRSLGVRCGYCHTMGQWDKDDKDDKQAAREMMKMTQAINTQYLANMKNLMSEHPQVTCATCHRGQEKPATTMEGTPEGHAPKPAPAKPDGR
jgi:hypothetical protein